MTLYLAGPINKCSDKQAMSWREKVKGRLCNTNLRVLDPMRRDYRGDEDNFVTTIVEADLKDIENSDILLVNAWKPSVGTSMETWHAFHNLDKKIVVVADENCSPWLKHCADEHFTDLSKALDYITQ